MLEVLSNAASRHPDCDTASIVELQREIDCLTALQAQQIAQWDAELTWADDGSRSPAHRFSRETGVSVSGARRVVHRARALKTMPLAMELFASGSLATSRVDLLVHAIQPKLASLYQRDDAMLLDIAKISFFNDAQKGISYWIQCAKDEVGFNKNERLRDNRSASIGTTFEGCLDVRALLDPIGGEIFRGELSRLEQVLFEQDWARANEIHGDEITIGDLERTPTQRRADALVQMAKRSASMPAGAKPMRPLITIHAGFPKFSQMCELANGTVISPELAVPLLTEAEIETVVFQSPKRVMDIRHKRLFTGALRRVIQVRDRRCQDPSECNVPADESDVDHILAWTQGGLTVQENGQCLCPWHNRLKGATTSGSGPP